MAKGEIAHDEQFLLLPKCFQNMSAIAKGLKFNFPEVMFFKADEKCVG